MQQNQQWLLNQKKQVQLLVWYQQFQQRRNQTNSYVQVEVCNMSNEEVQAVAKEVVMQLKELLALACKVRQSTEAVEIAKTINALLVNIVATNETL